MSAQPTDSGGSPAPSTPPSERPPAPPRPLWPRVLLALVIGVALLLALLAGGAAWLWNSPRGLQWALDRVPGLRIEGAQGRPTGGAYAVQRLTWQGGGTRVVVEGLAWDGASWRFRPHAGAWVGLALQQPRAARVQVTTTPKPGPAEPSRPPTSLAMPFELQAPGLRIGRVEIDAQAPLTGIAADVHVGAVAGGAGAGGGSAVGTGGERRATEHRVLNLALQRDGFVIGGRAVVGAGGEMPVDAQITAAPPAGTQPPWQAAVQLRGPLQRLAADADLRHGSGAQATAQATLAPFAPWPLLALQAQTSGLDLATLDLRLPVTRLSGRAVLAEPGRAQTAADPLAIDLTLDNAEPGPWDAGRVPLQSLVARLRGRPAEPGTYDFEQLQARLAGSSPPTATPPRPAAAATRDSAARPGASGTRSGTQRPVRTGAVTATATATPTAAAPGGASTAVGPSGAARAAVAAQPAGLIQGSGRWQGRNLALTLQLQGLRPERLDNRAPPMALNGSIRLALAGLAAPGTPATPLAPSGGPGSVPATAQTTPTNTGLAGELTVDLQGQLPQPGTPPLTLQADSRFSMPADGSLLFTLVRAQAGARATGTGTRSRTGIASGTGTGTGTGTDVGTGTGTASASASATTRSTAATALATATATAARDTAGAWRVQSRGELRRFDPAPWWPAAAAAARGAQRIDGNWVADLNWSTTAAGQSFVDALRGSARVSLGDTRLAGLAIGGTADLQATAQALQLQADLQAGPNRVQARGNLPRGQRPVPQGQLAVQAPQLAALAPLAQLLPSSVAAWWPTAGTFNADARIEGSWPALRTEGTLRAQGVRSRTVSIGQADARWNLPTDLGAGGADTPLSLQLGVADLAFGIRRLDRLDAALQGTLRAHELQLRAASPLRPPAWAEAAAGVPGPGGSAFRVLARGGWTPVSAAGAAAPGNPATGAAGAGTWRGTVSELRAAPRSAESSPWLAADNLQASVTLGPGGQPLQAALAPGRITAFGGGLAWQQASWQAPATPGAAPQMALQARLDPVLVAPWLSRFQPQFGWEGDLALGGTIAVRSAERFDADIVIERTVGDLSLTVENARRSLGLNNLRLGLAAHDGLWEFTQALVGRGVGVVGGLQTIRTTAQAAWPEATAPLTGGLSLQVPELGVWAPWLPPGWRLGGQLRVAAAFTGRFGAPEYRGDITGEALSVRNLFEGIHLRQGQLAVALTGMQATVERFEFRDGGTEGAAAAVAAAVSGSGSASAAGIGPGASPGRGSAAGPGASPGSGASSADPGPGVLRMTGGATFGETPGGRLRIVAERLRALDRYDRRITLSGSADLGLQAGRVSVGGNFTVDDGLVDATQADAPALDADVRVVNRAPLNRPLPAVAAASPEARPPGPAKSPLGQADVDLRIDLGNALRLRGRGLDAILRGRLRVSTPEGQLAVNGVVSAEGGTYTAYGQNLRIERGNIRFSGDVGTPQLDILALRADIDTRVGVVVTGGVVNPRVRLYSEPELGQLDTLTWLLLGRAPEGLGRDDTALLQRAALALLAGERSSGDGLIQRLGLDELSLRRGGGSNGTGGTLGDTVVSLGKQLSRRLFVGYEQALGSAGGTVQLIYRVAGRLTLRARTGADNAIDAIWTWRWD